MVRYRVSAGIASILVASGLAAGASLVAAPAYADEATAEGSAAEQAAAPETGTVEAQSIGLEGVSNARQVGGYLTEDGRRVKDGVLLRTGALSGATEADLERLVDEYNLGFIVDMRTDSEIASAPDPDIEGVENIRCPIMETTGVGDEEEPAEDGGDADDAAASDEAAGAEASEDEDGAGMGALAGAAASTGGSDAIGMLVAYAESSNLEDMYVDMVQSEFSQQGYREFFDVLLNNEDGHSVLWHCTGGKDRAGLAGVLLLSALGVDRETALDDFALTNEFVADQIDQMTAAAGEAGYDEGQVEAVATLTGVDRDYMAKALDLIDEEYGGMDEYLRNQIGLTDDEIAQLQEMYLEG